MFPPTARRFAIGTAAVIVTSLFSLTMPGSLLASAAPHLPSTAATNSEVEITNATGIEGFDMSHQRVHLTGKNLTEVTEATIGGEAVYVRVVNAGLIELKTPKLTVGTHPIVLTTKSGAAMKVATFKAASAEAEIVKLVNKARAKKQVCGGKVYKKAKALKVNAKLTKAARAHSADMASKNYFSHYSKNGASPYTRMKQAGYKYKTAGENIAAGYTTPAATVEAWLKSPGHCRNLMNKSFTQIGVGYAEGGYYGKYWTQDFGKPKK